MSWGAVPAATPTFSPVAGSYVGTQTVTISTTTTGCGSYIYWSATNNPPTISDTHGTSASIAASGNLYAKVIGCPGSTDSAVGTAAYTITSLGPPVSVTVTGTTATQAILSYTAPDSSACSVKVSTSGSYFPLVYDVDPSIFSGSNLDSRAGSISIGLARIFVAGTRTVQAASGT